MKLNMQHLDEGEILFFENQLQQINSQVFEKKYPKLKSRDVFPVNNEERPGVNKLTSRIYDETGMAKIISNYADDLPRVDKIAKEYDIHVKTLGDAYGYSIDDIKAARRAGVDLDGSKAVIAHRKMLVRENRLSWFGDPDYNIQGFLNHPNIPLTTVPADGQGGLTTFESKDPDKIIRDITNLFNSVEDQTNEVHSANTLLLASDQAVKTALSKRVPDTSITVMKYLKENHPEIQKIVFVKELNNPFGNGNMMVAGEFNENNLTLEITEEFNALNPQPKNLEYVINCTSKVAGVDTRFPMAFAFADGI